MGAGYRNKFREALWELVDGSDGNLRVQQTNGVRDWLETNDLSQFYRGIVRAGYTDLAKMITLATKDRRSDVQAVDAIAEIVTA